MKLSIKMLLIAVAYVCFVLAALVSRSAVAMEVVSAINLFAILMAISLAIFDTSADRRPFWSAYSIVGTGFLIGTTLGFFTATNTSIVELICKQVSSEYELIPPPSISSPPMAVNLPNTVNVPTPAYLPPTSNVLETWAFRRSVVEAVPLFMSTMFAILAGIAKLFFARGSRKPPVSIAG